MFVYLSCASLMNVQNTGKKGGYRRLLYEPMVHFFVLGVLLFGVDQGLGEEQRQIRVTPFVKDDLRRRFVDEKGRRPSASEESEVLAKWKRDEALYREALRKGLDRNDAAIRDILIQKMKDRAAFDVAVARPDDAQLERFLSEHRERYERPRRFDFQYLSYGWPESGAPDEAAKALSSLRRGADPTSLGPPVTGGKLRERDLHERIPSALAEVIVGLKPGRWTRVEGTDEVWVVRLRAIEGGLPPLAEVREGLVAAWKAEVQEELVEKELQKTVDLYHFEEQGR